MSGISSGTKKAYESSNLFDEGEIQTKGGNHMTDVYDAIMSMRYQSQEAAINRDWQSMEAEIARHFNSDEAQKARDFELDMWNKTNEYNDPAAVRQRLVDAGYNPLWLDGGNEASLPSGASAAASPIGSGAQGQGVSVGTGALSAATSKIGQISSMLDTLGRLPSNITEGMMRHALIDADLDVRKAQTFLATQQANTQREGLPFIAPRARADIASVEANASLNKALKDYNEHLTSMVQADTLYKEVRNKWSEAEFAAKYDEQLAKIENIIQDSKLKASQQSYNDAATGMVSEQTNLYKAETALTGEKLRTQKALTSQEESNARILALTETLKKYGISEDSPFFAKTVALTMSGKISTDEALMFARQLNAYAGYTEDVILGKSTSEVESWRRQKARYIRLYNGDDSDELATKGRSIYNDLYQGFQNYQVNQAQTDANATEELNQSIIPTR